MTELAEPTTNQEQPHDGRPATVARFDVRGFRQWPVARQFFVVLIALYLVKQLINVFIFPPFTGHDEVAHFSYVQTVATEWRVPKIPILAEFQQAVQTDRGNLPGDWLPEELYRYCRYILDWYYCNEEEWANRYPRIVVLQGEYYPIGWQYTANHPPLYYAFLTPIYKLSEGATAVTQQYLLRAAAIPFGLAIVVLSYFLVRTLFPRDEFLGVTVPAFVALQPQVSYEAAMINNDVAGIAFFSLILYLLVFGLKRGFSYRLCAVLGLSFGVGLLFKGTTLAAVPLIAVTVVCRTGLRHMFGWLSRGALIASIGLVLSWSWYLFLYRTYGNFSALDQIADNQWNWTYNNQSKPSFVDLLWNSEFALFRWHETWGLFGWRLIYYSDRLLWAIGVPCIVASVGLVFYVLFRLLAWRFKLPSWPAPAFVTNQARWQVAGVGLMALAAVVSYGAMLQFGTRFSLTQARYVFPAIIAFAVLLMVGLRTLLPEASLRYAQAAVVSGLVLLNVVIYSQYVIPYWYLGG